MTSSHRIATMPCPGKKRLLRKSEYRKLPTAVAKLAVNGNRVYVGDASQSFLYLKWVMREGLWGFVCAARGRPMSHEGCGWI